DPHGLALQPHSLLGAPGRRLLARLPVPLATGCRSPQIALYGPFEVLPALRHHPSHRHLPMAVSEVSGDEPDRLRLRRMQRLFTDPIERPGQRMCSDSRLMRLVCTLASAMRLKPRHLLRGPPGVVQTLYT